MTVSIDLWADLSSCWDTLSLFTSSSSYYFKESYEIFCLDSSLNYIYIYFSLSWRDCLILILLFFMLFFNSIIRWWSSDYNSAFIIYYFKLFCFVSEYFLWFTSFILSRLALIYSFLMLFCCWFISFCFSFSVFS